MRPTFTTASSSLSWVEREEVQCAKARAPKSGPEFYFNNCPHSELLKVHGKVTRQRVPSSRHLQTGRSSRSTLPVVAPKQPVKVRSCKAPRQYRRSPAQLGPLPQTFGVCLRHLASLLLAVPLLAAAQSPNLTAVPASQFSSSVDGGSGATADVEPQYSKSEREAARRARYPFFDDQYHFGLLAVVGTGGIGAQIGYPLSQHVVVRGGAEFYRYTQESQRDETTYGGTAYLGDARVSVDYFPWRQRRFHISPLVIFANQTHAVAHFDIQANAPFDLEDGSYYGTDDDPLHGRARMDFRRTSPGLALGFGNLTHGHGHWLFPVEFGFYYNSTPTFSIDFTSTLR